MSIILDDIAAIQAGMRRIAIAENAHRECYRRAHPEALGDYYQHCWCAHAGLGGTVMSCPPVIVAAEKTPAAAEPFHLPPMTREPWFPQR